MKLKLRKDEEMIKMETEFEKFEEFKKINAMNK